MFACPTLAPPPQSRHRACSASVVRRRSPSFIDDVPPSPISSVPAPVPASPSPVLPPVHLLDTDPPAPSMLVILVSRVLEWLHVQPNHPGTWSTPSSPRSSAENAILPTSSASQKSSFSDQVRPKISKSEPPPPHPRLDFVLTHAPFFLVILLFPLSTALVLFCLSTLPISLSWPRTISDVAQLGRELHGYTQSGPTPVAHVVGVMAVTAVWKHAWSVPGSVIWNVLAGALFSPAYATVLLTTLTMLGSVCATLLSMPLAPFLTYFFPRALDRTRSALEGDSESRLDSEKQRSSAWVRLSILRLIGVVPWSGINIACGVCGVSIADCMMGAFIGCLPWTAVTCQIGDILQTVASTPSPTPQTISSLLASPKIILKLVFLSFLSLAPILGRDRLRQLISPSLSGGSSRRAARTSSMEASKWVWIEEWRSKLRLNSRAQHQERSLRELAVLVHEKHALEDLPS